MNNTLGIGPKSLSNYEVWDGSELEEIVGFEVAKYSDCIIIAQITDWVISRYIAVREGYYSDLGHDEQSLFYEKVLSCLVEGEISFSELPLNYSNFKDIVNFTVENKILFSFYGGEEADFQIAKVVGRSDQSIITKIFHADGNWDGKLTKVKLIDIKRIDLFDSYTDGLNSYLKLSSS